jgi:phosphoribosylaminoimidazole-succinocarboxamide synthase
VARLGQQRLGGRTTANIFRLLAREGVRTHYVDDPEPTVMLVERCAMLPLEVVMRRIATGSYLKRKPDVSEGTRFDPLVVEYFFKDDANHDPQITEPEIVEQGLASAEEVEQIAAAGRQVFEILERAWSAQDVQLVDLKIEFGRTPEGALVVADVIDNDSWRIWPGGEKERMLDKQIYRNMKDVTAQGLDAVRERYAQVAEMTEAWRG